MHPIFFSIGDFPIHTFGVMVLLCVIATLTWVGKDAPRVGIKGDDLINIGIEVFIAGLIGSRILFIWLNWDGMYANLPWYEMLNLRTGGLVWYGGLLAAAPTGFWRSKAYGVPVRQACDVMAGAVMLGLCIGRVGCLMAGDDHGRVNFVPTSYALANMATNKNIVRIDPPPVPPFEGPQEVRYAERTWWTLEFTDPNALTSHDWFKTKFKADYPNLKEDQIRPLEPAQPAMSLGALAIFLILFSVRKRLAHAPSALTALLFTLYPIHRFLVEGIRGDIVRGRVPEDVFLFGGLSTSQAISAPIVPIALGFFVYFVVKYRGASPPEPLDESAEEEGKDGEKPKKKKQGKQRKQKKAVEEAAPAPEKLEEKDINAEGAETAESAEKDKEEEEETTENTENTEKDKEEETAENAEGDSA